MISPMTNSKFQCLLRVFDQKSGCLRENKNKVYEYPMKNKIVITSSLTKPQEPCYYGTAGYRSKTKDCINIISRASFIAYLRSSSFAGKRIGLVITASHNPIEYNGVKFIDHNGNMFDSSWEKCSDDLVNCEDKDFPAMINKIFRKNSNLGDIEDGVTGHVVLGRDTRPSGSVIVEKIKEVLSLVNCEVEDYGQVTTPEMHFLIRKCNEENRFVEKQSYVKHLIKNFLKLTSLTNINVPVAIDTANGVVHQKLEDLESLSDKDLKYKIINSSDGILNKNCGADYVKSKKRAPPIEGFDTYEENKGLLYCSFDGDADRLIMFTLNDKFCMIDGDAQAAYLSHYIDKLCVQINVFLTIGIVISHYSNNSAFESLKKFKVDLQTTGVKNFVKAARKYDIGVYFEPNGHGSVVFSSKAVAAFTSGNTTQHQILSTMANLFDPCIGDALANFLIFKSIITSTENMKNYKENASRLLTVKVKDKNIITVNSRNEVTNPPGVQEKIDAEVLKMGGRSFVRPSGTEDLIRVYAECSSGRDADILALKVSQIVYDMCEGVGNHPEIDYTK